MEARLYLLLSLLVLLGNLNSYSQFSEINTINTGVSFLQINADTRTAGQGDIGIAGKAAFGDVHKNISKLAFLEHRNNIAADYVDWAFRTYMLRYGSSIRIGENHTLAVTGRWLRFSRGIFLGAQGTNFYDHRPEEYALDLGYAYRLSPKFSLGTSVRFISSNLASGANVNGQKIETARGIAADIGAYYNTSKTSGDIEKVFSAGIAITNVGGRISYIEGDIGNYIPTNLGIGVNYSLIAVDHHRLSSGLEINKLLVPTADAKDEDNNGILDYREKSLPSAIFGSFSDAPGGAREELRELMFSLGFEYAYSEIIAVRWGFFSEHETKGNRKYFTLGLGGYIKPIGLGIHGNYIVGTSSTFPGKIWRVGLTSEFGG